MARGFFNWPRHLTALLLVLGIVLSPLRALAATVPMLFAYDAAVLSTTTMLGARNPVRFQGVQAERSTFNDYDGGRLVYEAPSNPHVAAGVGAAHPYDDALNLTDRRGVVEGVIYDAPAPTSAAEGAEHIALGLEHVVEEQAESVGATHLMDDPNWKQTFMNALAGGNTRFTVFLDNLVGRAGTIDAGAYDKVMTSVLRNATAVGGATDFEISQLYQAGRLGSVTFMQGGAVVPNRFQ